LSIVQKNRKQLEALGDYVTRANIDWFAIFPEKLNDLEQIAAENGRELHLVVYRTRTENARDHHSIPLSKVSDLFDSDFLTHSEVNGSIRWNVTLKDNIFRVAHNNKSIDITEYLGSPLAVELEDPDEKVFQNLAIDITPPKTARIESTVYRIIRDTRISKSLKEKYDYCCQICGQTIHLPDGSRYAEAHHIRPLGNPHNGPDCIENLIVLCPNHHAMCDYGAIKLEIEKINVLQEHNIQVSFIEYHNQFFKKYSVGIFNK
jgi:predicted restriction endonuclease